MPNDSEDEGAEPRTRRALRSLGLELEEVHRLEDALAASYSAEAFGLVPFAHASDPSISALASDQVIASVDAIETNLAEAALHACAFADHVGPNGRAMPGPDDTEEDDLGRIRASGEIVGFFRAIGSTLDCVSAVTIGVLRLPSPIHRADAGLIAGGLERDLAAGFSLPEEQIRCIGRVAATFGSLRAEPAGWLEWTVETRNRAIHRSRQMDVWMPRPRPIGTPTLLVRTHESLTALTRFEPHLRHFPWLVEIAALATAPPHRQWLNEPAHSTLSALLRRVNELVEAACAVLHEAWVQAIDCDWPIPDQAWAQAESGPRWRRSTANLFEGFDPSYPVPAPTAMHVSPRDGVRLKIAQQLRLRHARGRR
jgi:hypothetical protein